MKIQSDSGLEGGTLKKWLDYIRSLGGDNDWNLVTLWGEKTHTKTQRYISVPSIMVHSLWKGGLAKHAVWNLHFHNHEPK
jgi:hypothetical protein